MTESFILGRATDPSDTTGWQEKQADMASSRRMRHDAMNQYGAVDGGVKGSLRRAPPALDPAINRNAMGDKFAKNSLTEVFS